MAPTAARASPVLCCLVLSRAVSCFLCCLCCLCCRGPRTRKLGRRARVRRRATIWRTRGHGGLWEQFGQVCAAPAALIKTRGPPTRVLTGHTPPSRHPTSDTRNHVRYPVGNAGGGDLWPKSGRKTIQFGVVLYIICLVGFPFLFSWARVTVPTVTGTVHTVIAKSTPRVPAFGEFVIIPSVSSIPLFKVLFVKTTTPLVIRIYSCAIAIFGVCNLTPPGREKRQHQIAEASCCTRGIKSAVTDTFNGL